VTRQKRRSIRHSEAQFLLVAKGLIEMGEGRPNGLDRLGNRLQLFSHGLQVSDRSERYVARTGLGEYIGNLIGRIIQIRKRSFLHVTQTDSAIDAPVRPVKQRAPPILAHPSLIRHTFPTSAVALQTRGSQRLRADITCADAQSHKARLLFVFERCVKAFDWRANGVYGSQDPPTTSPAL
jgi:hypothetical protein